MTDHCAKEKKDVVALGDLKKEAILQQLGEDKMLDTSSEDLLPIFLDAHKEMIKNLGEKQKWNQLSEYEQKESLAQMSKKLVIELGKDAYAMMSEEEQKTLSLFIWAGCGCHKDLNSVHGGYAAIASWWKKNNISGPVLLANQDNAAVLAETSSTQNVVTPAQEHAFEMTACGGIKATQLAGAVFNHKDDKKGHHNTFCF